MKVLVIGAGGREHVLVWALAQSPSCTRVYCAPGNGGTADIATNVEIAATDRAGLATFAAQEGIGLTVVGPEAPLAAGIVDEFARRGLCCCGPTQVAARIESSKVFARDLMREAGVPAPDYVVFDDPDAARDYADTCPLPAVFKADGLSGGKGTLMAHERAAAREAVERIMVERAFGAELT